MRSRSLLLASVVVAAALCACSSKNAFPPEDSGAAADLGPTDAASPADAARPDGGAPGDSGVPGGDASVRDVATASDAPVGTCMARDLGSAVGAAVATGDSTTGATASSGSCGGEDGPESVLAWTAPANRAYTFTTAGSDFDTVLYVNDGACDGEELDCNDDDDDAKKATSTLTITLRQGQRVFIFVDGYDDVESGAWTLNIN